MSASKSSWSSAIGLLFLRVGIGNYMISHGWGKFQMLWNGKYADFADPLGMGKQMSLYGAVAGEVLAPAALALGLLTRLSAVGLAFTMGVAAFVVHADDPWTMAGAIEIAKETGKPKGDSKEMAMLYLIPAVALVLTGPGKISLDQLLFSKSGKGGGES